MLSIVRQYARLPPRARAYNLAVMAESQTGKLTAVETITKGAVALAAVAYAAGLLIVNSSLARFGIVVSDLARAEYALAGATFTLLFSIVYGATHFARGVFLTGDSESWSRSERIKRTLKYIFVAQVFGWIPLNFASGGDLDVSRWEPWVTLVVFVYGSVCFDQIVRFFVDGWTAVVPLRHQASGDVAARAAFYAMIASFTGLVVSALTYAFLIYPDVPAAFGGGRHADVAILCSSASQDVCRSLPLPHDRGGHLAPVRIVAHSSSGAYVVPAAGSKLHPPAAVWLKSDMVQVIVFSNNRAPARPVRPPV